MRRFSKHTHAVADPRVRSAGQAIGAALCRVRRRVRPQRPRLALVDLLDEVAWRPGPPVWPPVWWLAA